MAYRVPHAADNDVGRKTEIRATTRETLGPRWSRKGTRTSLQATHHYLGFRREGGGRDYIKKLFAHNGRYGAWFNRNISQKTLSVKEGGELKIPTDRQPGTGEFGEQPL